VLQPKTLSWPSTVAHGINIRELKEKEK